MFSACAGSAGTDQAQSPPNSTLESPPPSGPETTEGPSPEPNNTPVSEEVDRDPIRDAATAELIPPPSPIDQFRLSDDDDRTIYETWQQAMAACMSDAGFEFDMTPYSVTDATRAEVRTPIDASVVARYGYHKPPALDAPSLLDGNDERAKSNAAFRSALFGDDNATGDGCRGRSFAQVYAEDGEFFQLDQELGRANIDALVRLDGTDRLRELNEEWSTCMADQGFDYAAPDQPGSQFAGAETVTPEEVSTCQADIKCQLDVNYVRRTSAWIADDVNQWLDENAETLNRYLELKDDYLRNLNGIRQDLGLE